MLDGAVEVGGPDSGPPVAPDFSDEAIALIFADRHEDDLRYVAAWGRWELWDGRRWVEDGTLKGFDLVRHVCRDMAEACPPNKQNIAKGLASGKTVAAVHTLVRADRRLAATVEQWDRDPWILNTPGGEIDLRTGECRAHRRESYCTKITAVAPGGDCPLWRDFLDEVTNGDRDLQGYLQRVAGYCLTGLTREHALFFLYGLGANGKSVFINTLAGIMGDYATSAPIDTFMAASGERHPTDLADLRGARLVTAVETEEGRRWAEAKLKVLTGGDPIKARFMRQNFFEYTPQFKLLVAGNNRPGLRSVDEAMRRRLHLIPFTVTIPEEKRDPDLPEKLKAEWPGILAWMIAGAVEWAREQPLGGLHTPTVVRRATDDYFESEDSIAAWLHECCDNFDPDAWTPTAELFGSWKAFAERSGEPAGTLKSLSQALQARNYALKRQRHNGTQQRGFVGIHLALRGGVCEAERRFGGV